MKFDEFKKYRAPVVSKNVELYRMASLRYNGLLLDFGSDHPELIRVEKARAAVLDSMSADEVVEYKRVYVPKVLTAEEKIAERDALIAAMEANKDSPSI